MVIQYGASVHNGFDKTIDFTRSDTHIQIHTFVVLRLASYNMVTVRRRYAI